jgi:plasmid stabilization system protein ParE
MTTLYDQDFHAWALAQAAALRRAAELRINLPDVDIEHLAEEIEDMGSEQAHAVESALARIIEHLLKLQYSPSPSPLPRRGWKASVGKQRTNLARRLRNNPSLKAPPRLQEILRNAWEDGRRLAVIGMEAYGEAAASIPQDCPYSFEQLCDFDWWPDGEGAG